MIKFDQVLITSGRQDGADQRVL